MPESGQTDDRSWDARFFPAWEHDILEKPPAFDWRNWTALTGPGLLMAGANVVVEWLFGPIVTAR